MRSLSSHVAPPRRQKRGTDSLQRFRDPALAVCAGARHKPNRLPSALVALAATTSMAGATSAYPTPRTPGGERDGPGPYGSVLLGHPARAAAPCQPSAADC